VGGIAQTKALYFTTQLSWSPANRREDTLTEKNLMANVRIAEEEMEQAYLDYMDDRDSLALEIMDLERWEGDLELDRVTAELALEETLARYQSGLADDEELVRAQWETEAIDYDDRLLALDRLISQVQLRGLTTDDEVER
jgi:hypothetical protein